MIFKSVTTRVIFITITLLTFGISAFTFFNLKKEQQQLIKSARESTEVLLNTIEGSIYNSMKIGNTEETGTILEMVGRSYKLVSVRIFHPHGVVLKSSRPDEIGKPVSSEDYQLYINNQKEGVINGPQGESLRMLKPIYNDHPCHPCHGTKTKVIGVLDINYSLIETKKRMVETTNIFIISTIAIILFLSGAISFVMLKFVRKPLNLIVDNMAKVEKGDLSVRLPPAGKDEVGRLIVSFNSMVDRLDATKQELNQFHFQQMERADRLASVGEMAAGIAHEIKNPLTGIAAAMSVIKEDFPPADPRTEIVNEVLSQIQRLDKSVNDFLYFGKPTHPEPACVDINSILHKTIMFASQHRGGKNVEKKLLLQENLPFVYVDPKQVQQVFLNLILNAIQAMHDGGVLTVASTSLEKDGDIWVRVSIADTGPGIPAQILEKIFTPFFTTKAQGTGLGLAICYKLISQHGGNIFVESEIDKGTTFSVELRAYDETGSLPVSGERINGLITES